MERVWEVRVLEVFLVAVVDTADVRRALSLMM